MSFRVLTAPDGKRIVPPDFLIDAYKVNIAELATLTALDAEWLCDAHDQPCPPETVATLGALAIHNRASSDLKSANQRSTQAKAAAAAPRPSRHHPARGRAMELAADIAERKPGLTVARLATLVADELAHEFPKVTA